MRKISAFSSDILFIKEYLIVIRSAKPACSDFEYYDHDVARENSIISSVSRPKAVCCEEFYYNMVILRLDPPFEGNVNLTISYFKGFYPCKPHMNWFISWRNAIIKSENNRRCKLVTVILNL